MTIADDLRKLREELSARRRELERLKNELSYARSRLQMFEGVKMQQDVELVKLRKLVAMAFAHMCPSWPSEEFFEAGKLL